MTSQTTEQTLIALEASTRDGSSPDWSGAMLVQGRPLVTWRINHDTFCYRYDHRRITRQTALVIIENR